MHRHSLSNRAGLPHLVGCDAGPEDLLEIPTTAVNIMGAHTLNAVTSPCPYKLLHLSGGKHE